MVELVISTHEVLGSIPSPSIKKRGEHPKTHGLIVPPSLPSYVSS